MGCDLGMAAKAILNDYCTAIPATDPLHLITVGLTVNIEYLHFAYPGFVDHVNQYGIRNPVDESLSSGLPG